MQIDYLANHLEFLERLAQWHHEEWAYLRPGDTVEARIERMQDALRHRELPTTVIAFEGATLLGSAMLLAHDMDTRPDLSPWLAGVYVSRDHRARGIGAALVERVVEEARTLAVPRLYLYTPGAEGFYTRLGWVILERTRYRGSNAVVMSRHLQDGAHE